MGFQQRALLAGQQPKAIVTKVKRRGAGGAVKRGKQAGGSLLQRLQIRSAVSAVIDVLHNSGISLAIQNQGFPDVVVWNPWVDKCAALADMPANGWRHMLCVEAAIARQPVILPAGEEWYGRQTLVAV